MIYKRFALYYLPPAGSLADFGSAWLGWDVVAGCPVPRLTVEGLEAVTETPAKYGFHATLKPPFRLHEGQDVSALRAATADLASTLTPASCNGLALAPLGRFLALVPHGDTTGIAQVAATCVRKLDRFRAPPEYAELERRRKAGLTPEQDALLLRWGYPYVMQAFRFHMTLTGRLSREALAHWTATLERHMPALPAPFDLSEIVLCGEREDGRFEQIERYRLAG